jgi:hypothetical protein
MGIVGIGCVIQRWDIYRAAKLIEGHRADAALAG